MSDRVADARLALLTLAAEDSYEAAYERAGAPIVQVPADPRLSPDWTVCGVLTAQDAVFRKFLSLDVRRAFYGWLLRSTSVTSQFLAVIRGTQSAVEWWMDAHFLPSTAHPAGGNVESGFYSLYRTLAYLPVGGSEELPLVSALTAAVGDGTLTITGHSLGAAAATFLTFDLADQHRLSHRVHGRFFASPKPGDERFAQAFDGQVADYVSYAFDQDEVPRTPPGFDYRPLPRLTTLTAGDVGIKDSVLCHHHLVTYASLLDPLLDLSTLPPQDAPYLACLLKPQRAS